MSLVRGPQRAAMVAPGALVTVDLRLRVMRDEDERLSGTVTGAGEVRSFSGVLELMRVFEDLVPRATSDHPIDDEE